MGAGGSVETTKDRYTADEAKELVGDAWSPMYEQRFKLLADANGNVSAEQLAVLHNITRWDECAVEVDPSALRDDPMKSPRGENDGDEEQNGAAKSLQNNYRRYEAQLKVQQKRVWKMYQTLEYSDERQTNGLKDFLSKLIKHLPEEFERNHGLTSRFDKKMAKGWPQSIEVEEAYEGPHLPDDLKTAHITDLLKYYFEAFEAQNRAEGANAPTAEPTLYLGAKAANIALHAKYILTILAEYLKMAKKLPATMHISTAIPKTISIIGDIHGQLRDLMKIFEINGEPSADNPYVFNGDLVDRGIYSVEVCVVLMGYELAESGSVYLNRGNHEDYVVTQNYGFVEEICDKYGTGKDGKAIANIFAEIFRFMPICSVIDNEILVIHAGISPRFSCESLDLVPRQNFPTLQGVREEVMDPSRKDEEFEGMKHTDWLQLMDATWSDPKGGSYRGFEENETRGAGVLFGTDCTADWLDRHGLSMMIRSHECVTEGYDIMHDGRLMTLFSASNYYGEEESNKGAFLRLDHEKGPKIVQFMTWDNGRPEGRVKLKESLSAMEQSASEKLVKMLMEIKDPLLVAFKAKDTEETGKITATDWFDILKEVSKMPDIPWDKIRDTLNATPDGTGLIDYKQFVGVLDKPISGRGGDAGVLSSCIYQNRMQMEMVFRLMDKDGSGTLSTEEFHEAVKIINACNDGAPIGPDEVSGLIKAFDFDGDGIISFNEFLEAIRLSGAA